AQGASITSTVIRPWPVATTPQPGQPVTGSQDSTSRTSPARALVTATRWRLGKSRRRSHRSQRSSASGHTQLWLSIVEVLGASRGKSPLIIEDLDVYPQLPRTTGAPTLNSEEPVLSRYDRCAPSVSVVGPQNSP